MSLNIFKKSVLLSEIINREMRKEYIIAAIIIVIAGLAFVTLSGSVFSGYHFMDCSEYFKLERDLSEMSWWKCLLKHIDSDMGGRFRPVWQLNNLFKTLLWGDNMLLQGFWQIFLNMIAAFLIYLLGRRIRWTHNESLLFAGISMIGSQSAVFYQTLTIEPTALISLILSWHFIISYLNNEEKLRKILSYAGFVVFSLLTALLRENFVLVLPASYLFYCMQYSKKYNTEFIPTIVNTLKTGLFLCLITLASLWAVLTFAGNGSGYGGIDRSTGIFTYLKCAIYLYGISGCILAFWAIIYPYRNNKAFRKESLFPVLLFLAITVPQIIIYGKSNIIDRYLFPAIAGCAFFSVLVYRELKNKDKPINELLWKNISLFLGIIILVICTLVVFSTRFQQEITRYVAQFQGQILQRITSVSSLQYLADSLPILGIAGLIAGSFLFIWGAWRNNHSIRNLSQLYLIGLLLTLFMNSGLAFASCKRYATRGYATENFLRTIIDHAKTDDMILVAGNPLVDMEGAASGIYEYLYKQNRQNLYICPVTNNQQEEELIPCIKEFYHQKDIHTIENKGMIRVIAIFPGSETGFVKNNDWFEVNSFNKYEFTGNYVVYVRK